MTSDELRSLIASRLDGLEPIDRDLLQSAAVLGQVFAADALAAVSGMELDALIIHPYTDFSLGKQRFTLIAEPPKPIDLTRLSLYKPSDVPNLLNLTAETG